MINSPWETVSDSFYFAGDQLILQTKGLYNYEPFKEWSYQDRLNSSIHSKHWDIIMDNWDIIMDN